MLEKHDPLEEALARYDRPEIFNTDQGGPFTSPRFVEVLTGAGVRVSMDGRSRWMDNIVIERLWRSVKDACVDLYAFETGSEARAGLGRWITYDNADRPHSALGGRTPAEIYAGASAGIGWRRDGDLSQAYFSHQAVWQ